VKSGEPPGGMGEAGTSAIAPALTNAIFAATGNAFASFRGESSCVAEVLICAANAGVGHFQVRRLLPAAKRQARVVHKICA